MYKNQANQYISFMMLSKSGHEAITGLVPNVYVTKDGGSQTAGAGTVSELGFGQYRYQPTQAETNAGCVMFYFTDGSVAIPVNIPVYPIDVGVGSSVGLSNSQILLIRPI